MKKDSPEACCPPRPHVKDRPLISCDTAAEMEALFKVLGNGTRLRMLHGLVRAGELCVGDLAGCCNMKPQAISNQLQRLVDRGIVAARRVGNNIFYRVVNPCVTTLIDRGLCLLEDAQALPVSNPARFPATTTDSEINTVTETETGDTAVPTSSPNRR